jgi:hypothetical protein
MVVEAHLERVASGLAPVTAGWFVVNTADAAWVNNGWSGGVCIFESDDFVLAAVPTCPSTSSRMPGSRSASCRRGSRPISTTPSRCRRTSSS